MINSSTINTPNNSQIIQSNGNCKNNEINQMPQQFTKQATKKSLLLIILILFFLINLIACAAWYLLKNKNLFQSKKTLVTKSQLNLSDTKINNENANTATTSANSKQNIKPSQLMSQLAIKSTLASNFTTNNGFSLFVADNWSAQVSINDLDLFIASLLDENSNTLVKIEAGTKIKLKEDQVTEYKLLENKQLFGMDVSIYTGESKILTTQKQNLKVVFQCQNQLMNVKLNKTEIPKNVLELMQSISCKKLQSSSHKNILKNVFTANFKAYAQTVEKIGGFATQDFKSINIMAQPLPERLTNKPITYKTSRAHLYQFQALKGQQLKILAQKDTITGFRGSLLVDIFQQNGKMYNTAQYAGDIGWTADDKIQNKGYSSTGNYDFQAPYTGNYYFIIYSGCAGPDGSCNKNTSVVSELNGYSMQQPCEGVGMYQAALVTCNNDHQEMLQFPECHAQIDSIWMEQATNLCGSKLVADNAAYLLKIFDLQMCRNIYGVMYEDGSEYIINHFKKNPTIIGEKPFAITVRYPSAVDIVDDDIVRYYNVSDNFNDNVGLKILNYHSFIILEQTLEEYLANIGKIAKPENSQQLKSVKIYRLGTNTILIVDPETSYYPSRSHVGLVGDYADGSKNVANFFSF